MKKHSNDFGNDSVPGLVLRTSIPFMFAQFVNVLYSIVDRIYIGNIPQIGDVSLAGAGICAPVITLLSSFATLIGIGGSVLFSMRLGAKDQEKAKNLLGTSFSMLLVFSAASMVRRKQNNISLRQYLHDDLYTRHVLRPAVHGH